jgi:hypothetical protein
LWPVISIARRCASSDDMPMYSPAKSPTSATSSVVRDGPPGRRGANLHHRA